MRPPASRPSLFAELQRRHVCKVGTMYAVAGWRPLQVATPEFRSFHVDEAVMRSLVI